MTDQTTPAWISAGPTVAIYQASIGAGGSVKYATVEKVLKNYAVADGRKFRLTDRNEIGHKDAWRPAPQLREVNDPAVRSAMRDAMARMAISRLQSVIDKNPMHGTDIGELLRQVVEIGSMASATAALLNGMAADQAAEDDSQD